MTPSAAEAQGLERVSYPKSTKYGRQNPVAERWNSEEQLVLWRKVWADVVNLHLEKAGRAERIDHRSHAERGLDEQPTVHEGVVARALEKKGIVSDRCELYRQIKADNALLRELKAQMKKLAQAVKNSLPALAEAMEALRANMIVFRYQLRHISRGKYKLSKRKLLPQKPVFPSWNSRKKGIPLNLKLPSVNMQISKSRVQTLSLLNCMRRGWRCVRKSLPPHLIASSLLMAKSMILC